MESDSPTEANAEPAAPAGSGRATQVLVLVVILLGVVLRCVQYFNTTDMWHDELALARNIEARSLAALVTQPLDHHQVAPVGSLLVLKSGTVLLGLSEAGYRIGPWILSLLGLVLFWRVATRFANGGGLVAAVGLFAVSPAMVWYGASLKPYGGDVTASVLLTWLALRVLEQPGIRRRAVVAALVGAVTLQFSFPAVPTAAVLLAMVVFARWWRTRTLRHPELAWLSVSWAVGAAIAGGMALMLLDPETDKFMRAFWAADFPPGTPVDAMRWMWDRFYAAFSHSLVFLPARDPVLRSIVAVPAILATVGLGLALKQRCSRVILLLAGPVAGMAAACVHLLPFDQRLGLHATWPVLVLAGYGLSELRNVLRGRWRFVASMAAAVMALPLTAIVLLVAKPPYSAGDGAAPRTVLSELHARIRPGDRVYVYTQARHDMAYYGRRAGIESWTQGERHADEPREFLTEVDALRGESRVWFFWVRLDADYPALIREYLNSMGREIERIPDEEPGAAGAVLYDLSDPERLRSVDAATFSLDLPRPDARP